MKLARYDYNALGKPVVKYTKSYGGSWAVSSYFIWDGDQLLLELDGSGNRIADYTYFPGTIDQPAAQSIGATSVTAIRDFRFDGTGSVIGTVDGTAVSQKVNSSQWGGPDVTGTPQNHLFWKGLLYNEDVAGLIYMRGRWYDPAEGRFYNEDPIGHAGGENLYSFSNNDPINGMDPSGKFQGYSPCVLFGWCEDGSSTVGSGSAIPQPITCDLVEPGGKFNTEKPSVVALFVPEMATALTTAFADLNNQGIIPMITSGFRNPSDQWRMQHGGSGSNPAAKLSWHEVGRAVDINSGHGQFPTIISALTNQNLVWGGNFRKADPVHFQLADAGTSPTAAMISACGGH